MWVSKSQFQTRLLIKSRYMVRQFKPAIFQTNPIHQDNESMKVNMDRTSEIPKQYNIFDYDKVSGEYLDKYRNVVNRTEKRMRRRQNIYDAMGQKEFNEDKVDEFIKQDIESGIKSIFVDLIDEEEIEEAEQKLNEFMQNQSKQNKLDSEYMNRFYTLIEALGAKDEQQLMQIHGDCLAREKQTDFAQKAKTLILKQLVQIVQNQRKGLDLEDDSNELLSRLLHNPNSNSEFILSEIQGIDDNMKLESYLSDKIDNKNIEKVSKQLAKQEWQEQADLFTQKKQQIRTNQSEVMGGIDTRYMYIGLDNIAKIDPVYDPEMTLDDSNEYKYEFRMKSIELPNRLRTYSDEQQQIYQIYQRITKRYLKQKADILKSEIMAKGPVKLHGLENQDIFQKEISHDYFKEFGIAEDQLSKNINVIRDMKQPNMLEIYESIDYLVEGIHQNDFIKAKMRRDDLYRNSEFRPTFSHLNIQGEDLLWSQFKETFDTINNREYARDDFDDLEYVNTLNDMAEQMDTTSNPQYVRFALDKADKLYDECELVDQEDSDHIQSDNSENGNSQDQSQDSQENQSESEDIIRPGVNLNSDGQYMRTEQLYETNMKITGQNVQSMNLTYQDQYELELHKQVKKDQFFKHHLQQDIQYYSERNDSINHKINTNYIKQYTSDRLYEIEAQKYDKVFDIYQKKEEIKMKKVYQKSKQGQGRGRRKTSSASVVVRDGYGRVQINNKPFLQYFPDELLRSKCLIPIELVGLAGLVDVQIQVRSGGYKGQVEAIQQGLARAICDYDPSFKSLIRLGGLLYTDSRQVEKKKQGRYKARKSYTYVRR